MGFLTRFIDIVAPRASRSGPVDVGWLIDADEAGFIYDEPERVEADTASNSHPKSASRCPAVIDFETRLFAVPCPYDLNLQLVTNSDGALAISDLDGDRSAVRGTNLPRIVTMVKASEWRHPSRPIVQLLAPYRFISDEPVFLSQLPPFMSYRSHGRPGLMICGRMPIDIWPRILSFAFEWHDASKPLSMRRGEPWFYVQFETVDPARRVRLLEAQMTPELGHYIRGMSGVVGYVRRTMPLFKVAASRRPARLLTPSPRAKARA